MKTFKELKVRKLITMVVYIRLHVRMKCHFTNPFDLFFLGLREVSLLSSTQQIMENLSMSSGLVQDLQTSWQTLACSIQGLPQYVQHQLVSALFFICQMYNLSCPPSQQHRPNQERRCLNAAEPSTHKDAVQVYHRATPPAARMRWPTKTSPFDNGCNVKGCIGRW